MLTQLFPLIAYVNQQSYVTEIFSIQIGLLVLLQLDTHSYWDYIFWSVMVFQMPESSCRISTWLILSKSNIIITSLALVLCIYIYHNIYAVTQLWLFVICRYVLNIIHIPSQNSTPSLNSLRVQHYFLCILFNSLEPSHFELFNRNINLHHAWLKKDTNFHQGSANKTY